MRRESPPWIYVPLAVITLLMMSAVTGCEDVVQVNLKVSEPQLVIEGYVGWNLPGGPHFRITRSTDFFNPTTPEYVDDAQIIVTDALENVDTLYGVGNGQYRFHYLNLRTGNNYRANVTIGDRRYEATTTMTARIQIDSVTAQYQTGGGIGTGEDEGYRLHVYFTDPPGTHEYARIVLGNSRGLFSDTYYLYDGKFSDGKTVDYNYFLDTYHPGEFATVDIWAIDRSMYDYLSTLREAIVWDDPTNVFDVSPANPNSNWTGGALGFFGAFNDAHSAMEIPDTIPTGSGTALIWRNSDFSQRSPTEARALRLGRLAR